MRLILAADARFVIVGEAETGEEAKRLAAALMPDLILMDIAMPGMGGLAATKAIKDQFPYTKIVMVTVSDEVTDLFAAIKCGAQGYLLKNLQPSIWLDYLRAVMTDEAPVPREMARRILEEFRPSHPSGKEAQRVELTQREREILSWVAKGCTNREIAEELTISEYTVKNHLKNIMQKLHLKNRVQLARFAYQHEWIAPQE